MIFPLFVGVRRKKEVKVSKREKRDGKSILGKNSRLLVKGLATYLLTVFILLDGVRRKKEVRENKKREESPEERIVGR